ncbi:MAG TPA: sugar ABC transporter permease [Candidatus Limiplasma stercoravium]|nr:sugar ABC transporter permease [Candidatus Limiplasma stercoravium]
MRARPSIYNAKPSLAASYWKNRSLVALFVPAVAFYLLFKYLPIFGVQIAFKNYMFRLGIWNSPWIGFENFEKLFAMDSFWEVLSNTFIISGLKLVFGFPAPILLALLLNEIRCVRFKRVVQTISYLPHFLSWVILSGIFIQFLSPSIGPINILIRELGGKPIYFLGDEHWFRPVLIVTHIWKSVGWGTIVYLAALTNINPEFYEAAYIDGATRWHCARYITLPSLAPVITIMLIFAVGGIIEDDFNQIYNLYSEAVYSVGDVISTYTYRRGLVKLDYGFASAVDLFKNVVAFALILSANRIANRINEYGIW